MTDLVHIQGTAQTPLTLPREPNPTSRRADEMLPLTEQHGISYPEEVKLVASNALPPDVYAAYLLPTEVSAEQLWPWSRFLNRFEEIAIRFRPDILDSDEAIVAVLAHEAFELNGLFQILAAGNVLKSEQLAALINPGIDGNLHCRAWDDSDERITAWRASR